MSTWHCRSLAGQGLTGEIPDDSGLWSQLGSLSSVNLSGNQLSGYLPASLAQSPALTSLNLSNNALSGPLPALTSSSTLQNLQLGNNQLSGAPIDVPACLRQTASNLVGQIRFILPDLWVAGWTRKDRISMRRGAVEAPHRLSPTCAEPLAWQRPALELHPVKWQCPWD